MSNLLNFCYIVYNEESQKASVGSRSSLPSSNIFCFFLDRTVSCNSLHIVILVTTFAPSSLIWNIKLLYYFIVMNTDDDNDGDDDDDEDDDDDDDDDDNDGSGGGDRDGNRNTKKCKQFLQANIGIIC